MNRPIVVALAALPLLTGCGGAKPAHKATAAEINNEMMASAGMTSDAPMTGDMTPAAATGEAPPAAGGASIPAGDYECWAFNSPRMLLNFSVTGPGQYRASDGSTSSFTYEAGSGEVHFEGYLKDSIPDGWTTIYHTPQGKPTVSFRSARGAEASFCEHV